MNYKTLTLPIATLCFACNPAAKPTPLVPKAQPPLAPSPTTQPPTPPPVEPAPTAQTPPPAAPKPPAPPAVDPPAPPAPTLSFDRRLLGKSGLWHTQRTSLEEVKDAIKRKDSSYECTWEPLQQAQTYEWTWADCSPEAFAIFRVKEGTWTVLKAPSPRISDGVQDRCTERYIMAREHLTQGGQAWLIWSWEQTIFLQDEEFIDDCDEEGRCSSGRSGGYTDQERTQEYDVIIRPDQTAPSLVLRSQTDTVAVSKDGEDPRIKKGTQRKIAVSYSEQEVSATHTLATFKGKKPGKAKLVKKTKAPLSPAQWDQIICEH